MAFLLNVFRAQVEALLTADDDIFSQLNRDRQVQAAVERYSGDAPDTQTDDVSGDGGRYYAVAASLSGWVEGFSRITEIEYPAATVASDETPVYLEPEDWRDDYWLAVDSTQTRYLYLPSHAPAATEKMRITYTVPWPWSASSSTTAVNQAGHGLSKNDYVYQSDSVWYEAGDIRNATHQVTDVTDSDNFTAAILEVDVPQQDFFAICHLAAGLICQALAAKFARSSDSTISADSVRHMTRSGEHARRAKEFFALYEQHMGMGEADPKAAGEFVDWDTEPGWPAGRQFIFHGKGVR